MPSIQCDQCGKPVLEAKIGSRSNKILLEHEKQLNGMYNVANGRAYVATTRGLHYARHEC